MAGGRGGRLFHNKGPIEGLILQRPVWCWAKAVLIRQFKLIYYNIDTPAEACWKIVNQYGAGDEEWEEQDGLPKTLKAS